MAGKGNGLCLGFCGLFTFPLHAAFYGNLHSDSFCGDIIGKQTAFVFADDPFQFPDIDVLVIIPAGTELSDQQVGIDGNIISIGIRNGNRIAFRYPGCRRVDF